MVPHDQIKEELFKQNIIPLLIRCATEQKFDPVKARQRALDLLLSFTFTDDAACLLKQNTSFMNHLRTLLNAPEVNVQRAAESILWKLEKEAQSIANHISPTVGNQKYDVMMSYSHNDKNLCYEIHDRLIKDQFRVWIDREYLHGATMAAMADAIENSEFVLICMSESYKQSAYCQSEASYAFERRRHLIPLIMEHGYKPDGWLGIIASGKVYVDFHKLGIELAYVKLKHEIEQHRLSTKEPVPEKATTMLQHHVPTEPISMPTSIVNQQKLVT